MSILISLGWSKSSTRWSKSKNWKFNATYSKSSPTIMISKPFTASARFRRTRSVTLKSLKRQRGYLLLTSSIIFTLTSSSISIDWSTAFSGFRKECMINNWLAVRDGHHLLISSASKLVTSWGVRSALRKNRFWNYSRICQDWARNSPNYSKLFALRIASRKVPTIS